MQLLRQASYPWPSPGQVNVLTWKYLNKRIRKRINTRPNGHSTSFNNRCWGARCRTACPAVVAAPITVATWQGFTTVTSIAASCPAIQWGSSTSAGRLSSPGMRNLTSLTGPRPAATAVSWRWSRRWLWREIRSPPEPQHMAWLPKASLKRWQASWIPPSLLAFLLAFCLAWG